MPGVNCSTFLMAYRVFSCGVWTLCCGMRDLVAWSGIEPRPPTLGVPRLSHWTTGAVPTVSVCECPCTPSFSALLMIKPKEWTLSACVEDTQHFPTNIFHHKNHSRRAWTWETGYFCPVPFSPFYCLLFFWATSFTSSTFRGTYMPNIILFIQFYCQKKAFPMRLNSQWTWASGSWINSWQTWNILGLWHDVTLWPDLRKDLWELNSTGNAAPSSPSLCWEQIPKSLQWWPLGWTCSNWKWIFAPSSARWPNMQLGINPNLHLSWKSSYIIETGKAEHKRERNIFPS